MTLVAHTYVNYLLDRSRRAAEFATLGRLLARVPVRRVKPLADPARLSELCDAIVTDYQHHQLGARRQEAIMGLSSSHNAEA
jgi:hypothetical protein